MSKKTSRHEMENTDTFAFLSWCENFRFPTPAGIFLNTIGYSDDRYGELLPVAKEFDSQTLDSFWDAILEWRKMRDEDIYTICDYALNPLGYEYEYDEDDDA